MVSLLLDSYLWLLNRSKGSLFHLDSPEFLMDWFEQNLEHPWICVLQQLLSKKVTKKWEWYPAYFFPPGVD